MLILEKKIPFMKMLGALLFAVVLFLGYSSWQSAFAGDCVICAGDLDGNGVVDGSDLAAFAVDFGATTCCPAYSEDAIYVSGSNPSSADDPGAGLSPSSPAHTISFGISQALETGRPNVLVASGLYRESIELANGINVYGGYSSDFSHYDIDALRAIILPERDNFYTIMAQDITAPTFFKGFMIVGPEVVGTSQSSVAVQVENSSEALIVQNNIIYAGKGSDGIDGASGVDGSDGPDGSSGHGCIDSGSNSLSACNDNPLTPNVGGVGGLLYSSGGMNISGGSGASARCPNNNDAQPAGADGHGPHKGIGGVGGYDLYMDSPCDGSFYSAGEPAAVNGSNGYDGYAGYGGSFDQWTMIGSSWVSAPGINAAAGALGSGGGGGGAGSGADIHDCSGNDILGGSGGGGGAGGTPGTGGLGGGSAGGAFGIFFYYDTPPASQPQILQNTISLGRGGNGGGGGNGGRGGNGGAGGPGGIIAADCSWSYALGSGGDGGNGGSAGHGGGGGGAAGGSSFGIFVYGAEAPVEYDNLNTFDTTDAASGFGGGGGLSLGNSGTPGDNGTVENIHSAP